MEQYSLFEMLLSKLEKEINLKKTELQNYANSQNVNQKHLQIRSESLGRMIDIYNGFESLFKMHEPLERVARIYKEYQSTDPEIGIMMIHLHIKPNNENRALIIINPFEND